MGRPHARHGSSLTLVGALSAIDSDDEEVVVVVVVVVVDLMVGALDRREAGLPRTPKTPPPPFRADMAGCGPGEGNRSRSGARGE